MSDEHRFTRSPELMSRWDTGLLVVDVQEKVIQLVPDRAAIVWNIRRLLDGARVLGLPAFGTEQYPQGLGPTVPDLATRLGDIPAKASFSCGGCEGFCAALQSSGRHKLLVAGIEAHVCVQQTVLDLLAEGFRIYVAADAIGSRHRVDYEIALRRMESAATLTTTEAALFEWCQTSATAEFKQISQLIREEPPQ